MDGPHQDPEIITYQIPRIEIYGVSDDELSRIEEGYGQVGHYLTFATNFLSFGTAFLITLLTGTFSDRLKTIFTLVAAVCAIGFVISGILWLRQRKKVPGVIAKIRSRKTDPQVPPTGQS